MRVKMGDMSIPLSEIYNEEDDIYYVTFKTGEPPYCHEVDDTLILELGLFTNLPTGFRILNFKKSKVEIVNFKILFKKLKDTASKIDRPSLGDRENQAKKALQEVFA